MKNNKHLDLSKIYRDENSYFSMWCVDCQSMLDTMIDNLNADLNAGYNPIGDCIKRQQAEIKEYEEEFYDRMFKFIFFDNAEQVNNWCFIDMLKRGVIEL